MGAIVSLLLGGMIGRVAGPIAQDYFENETKIGRRIMSRKEERDIRNCLLYTSDAADEREPV